MINTGGQAGALEGGLIEPRDGTRLSMTPMTLLLAWSPPIRMQGQPAHPVGGQSGNEGPIRVQCFGGDQAPAFRGTAMEVRGLRAQI